MQHLDEGTVHAWLDDALPPSEAARVEAHVARCAECAALVAEARGLIAGASRITSSLDHVPAGVVPKAAPEQPSLWRTLRLTPARAGIAALVLVGVASMFTARRGPMHAGDSVRGGGPQSSVIDSTVHPRTAAASAPTVAVPSATPPRPQPTVAAKREVAELAKPSAPPTVQSSEMRASAPAPASAPALDAVTVTGLAAPQRMLRQAFDESTTSPEGCYRLLSDSARVMAMPERFALQRDSIGRHVVLRLSVENRPDSVLSGFAWRQVSPTVARLTAPTTQLVLTTNGSGRGRLESADGSADVSLQRTSCRP